MLAQFVPFELERLLSTWENRVEYNLSESGVYPLTLRELYGDTNFDALADVRLGYPQANGMPVLRERIAKLYPGARAENVLVTVGAISANAVALLATTEPGDTVAALQPSYQQLWGMIQNFDRTLTSFNLFPKNGWELGVDDLQRAVPPSTALVAIVNPHNPTGHVLSRDERRAVIETSAAAGAWLLADEVYAGAELTTDDVTPTFYGEYEKVLAINSTSKSLSLPGLRIGWVVGPADAIARMWAWQDYLTISTTKLGNVVTAHALLPEVRARILARSRDYVRGGFAAIEAWVSKRDDVGVVAPDAGGICFVNYGAPIGSMELATRLIERQSVLIAPGEAFGLDGYFRIGFALPQPYLNEGLARIGNLLDTLR
jgi:aspartate/methionine/tyrosine aminotransferase